MAPTRKPVVLMPSFVDADGNKTTLQAGDGVVYSDHDRVIWFYRTEADGRTKPLRYSAHADRPGDKVYMGANCEKHLFIVMMQFVAGSLGLALLSKTRDGKPHLVEFVLAKMTPMDPLPRRSH